MKITCKNCNSSNVLNEDLYKPGEVVEFNCRRCGEPMTVTMSGVTVENLPAQAISNSPANTAATNSDNEIEKAKLMLEAERIKLEHRKLDQEREMRQQQVSHQEPVFYETKELKSKTTAGILAILLGGIGVHKFYLGKTGKGLLYLLFCWTYIPGIIGLIEGISYLTKSDADFHANCY